MKTTSQPDLLPDPHEDAALSRAMDGLWARFLPDIRARVSVLETTARAASEGALTATQCEAAHSAAHKLAGVLGTFGLTRGTVLARELEVMLARKSSLGSDAAPKLAEAAVQLRGMIENRKPSA